MKAMLGLLVLAVPFICLADVVVPIDSVESFVNVRGTPEAGAEIVGRLQRGVPLTLVQSVEGWHEVEIDDEGTTGFVSSDWSTVIEDEPEGAAVRARSARFSRDSPLFSSASARACNWPCTPARVASSTLCLRASSRILLKRFSTHSRRSGSGSRRSR